MEKDKGTVTLADVVEELKDSRGIQEETAKNTAALVKSMKIAQGDALETKLKASRAKGGKGNQSQGLLNNIADNGVGKGLGITIFAGITTIFASIKKSITGLFTKFKAFGSKLKLLGRVAGKLFLPVTLALGAIEGIMSGWSAFQDGNYWLAAELAVQGFFRSIVAIPLNLIRDGVAFLLDKMGFDETSALVANFDFVALFDSMIGKIFDGLGEAVKVVKDLFTFTEEDKTALGLLGKLTDLVYAPINMVINYVRGLFGWSSEDETEPFKLQDWIVQKVNDGILWVKGLFSWAGQGIATGWTSLTDYISGKWEDTKKWFSDKLTWAGDTIGAGWTSLTTFTSTKWQAVKDFFTEKLEIATGLLPDINIMGMLNDLYERIRFNFMSSMEGLTVWFMTMPQKIGLSLEEKWVDAMAQLKIGFVNFASWVAGIPDMMLLAGVEKVRSVLGERLAGMVGLDTAMSNLQASESARANRRDESLERIDYETTRRLAEINEKRQGLETREQMLMDARQYVTNNTNSTSQAIVMADGATPTDTANGGSRFSVLGVNGPF